MEVRMTKLKRVPLVTALALAVVALAAVSASADIHSGASGTYSGPIKGTNTGPDPTLEAGSTTIVCTQALTGGTLDGDWDATGPASAVLDFSWDGCSTTAGVPCTVEDIPGVDVNVTEENAPDSTIVNTEEAGTDIVCGAVFQCHASSDPNTSPVTADVDSDTQVASINDTVDVTGLIACPGEGQWVAQYLITDENGASLDLFATGTQ
jgi:hypothetical protein